VIVQGENRDKPEPNIVALTAALQKENAQNSMIAAIAQVAVVNMEKADSQAGVSHGGTETTREAVLVNTEKANSQEKARTARETVVVEIKVVGVKIDVKNDVTIEADLKV
jgi:hypothetical protein